MAKQTKKFFDYFKREIAIDEKAYQTLLSDLSGSENKSDTIQEADRQFEHLYQDIFSHYIDSSFDINCPIEAKNDTSRRMHTSDGLTERFYNREYKPPLLYKHSSNLSADNSISYREFLTSMLDDPKTAQGTRKGTGIGSNLFTFLLGDIGIGKSLLLCKIAYDITKMQRSEPLNDYLLPVRFNFLLEMEQYEGHLEEINDYFYKQLVNSLILALGKESQVESFPIKDLYANFEKTMSSTPTNPEEKFLDLIYKLRYKKIRVMLMLDNIDGYHYHHAQYAFFDKFREKQKRSIRQSIYNLSKYFTNGEKFGNLGMSIIMAIRTMVYYDCFEKNDKVYHYIFSGEIYHIDPAGPEEITRIRIRLLNEHSQFIATKLQLEHSPDKHMQRLCFDHDSHKRSLKLSKIIKLIHDLCSHGNRELVDFLSKLKVFYNCEGTVLNRICEDKPYSLLLLYLVGFREKYTQRKAGSFPNIFLHDLPSTIDSNVESDFKRLHISHLPTYWLKFLILSYMASKGERSVLVDHLKRLFAQDSPKDGTKRFEKELFLLTLGELASPDKSRCIDPTVGSDNLMVKINSRGKALMSSWVNFESPFCFSFTYLQLIVDDYLMSYPEAYFNNIYDQGVNLKYLCYSQTEYALGVQEYLERKMKSVITFYYILKASYGVEQELRANFFKELVERNDYTHPDFSAILRDLMSQYEGITDKLPRGKNIFETIKTYSDEVSSNEKIMAREYKQAMTDEVKVLVG